MTRWLRITLAGLALGGLSPLLTLGALAEEAPPPPSTPQVAKAPYRVGAGDVLRVVVWKNPDLTGDYLVRPDGVITLPLAGDIIAGGMSTDTIGLQIERKLKYFLETPVVTVIVGNASSSQIYILGQVARPGAYPLPGPLTLLQALAGAGGFTPFADRNGILLLRREGEKQVRSRIRYDDLVAGEEKAVDLQLNRGDTLIVP